MSIPGLEFPLNLNKELDGEIVIATFDNKVVLMSHQDKIGKCRLVTEFEKLDRLGSGSYGVVYRARDNKNGEIVAMKKLMMEKEKEGLSVNCMREISILQKLKHPNIVNLKDVVVGKNLKNLESIFLVMEYCEQDLAAVLENMDTSLSEAQVKCIMMQLFTGLNYLHQHYVVHRDLKVSNLLLTDQGCLKIADFGLARRYGYPEKPMSPDVVTLWYRAPELLLMSTSHTCAVDMWSSGCIFAELLLNKPLLPGKSEIHQMELIINLLGTPDDQIWPGYSSLPIPTNFTFAMQRLNRMEETFPNLSPHGIELLNALFTYDPKRRIKAEVALKSTYFLLIPRACSPEQLLSFTPKKVVGGSTV